MSDAGDQVIKGMSGVRGREGKEEGEEEGEEDGEVDEERVRGQSTSAGRHSVIQLLPLGSAILLVGGVAPSYSLCCNFYVLFRPLREQWCAHFLSNVASPYFFLSPFSLWAAVKEKEVEESV